jgi:heptosyltransferase-2
MNNFQNILIVRTDRMGDVVLTTPCFEAMHRACPGAKITALISPTTYDLLNGNPFIDEIIVDDRLGEHRGFFGFWKIVKQLRRRKFDAAFIFHTKRRINSMTFWAGIPKRVGYKNKKFGFLLTDPIKDERHFGIKHEIEYCLDVLRFAGVQIQNPKEYIPIQPETQREINDLLRNKGILETDRLIAVHPGGSDETKRWPARRFVELINCIYEKYPCKIILIGAHDILPIIQTIKSQLKFSVIDLGEQTTLAQLVCVFKKCQLLISNDSGPVHLADALGTPVVAIFVRNQPGINPERWRPLGPKSRVIYPTVQEDISFAEGKITDPSYLEVITTSEVFEAVDSIFKLC